MGHTARLKAFPRVTERANSIFYSGNKLTYALCVHSCKELIF